MWAHLKGGLFMPRKAFIKDLKAMLSSKEKNIYILEWYRTQKYFKMQKNLTLQLWMTWGQGGQMRGQVLKLQLAEIEKQIHSTNDHISHKFSPSQCSYTGYNAWIWLLVLSWKVINQSAKCSITARSSESKICPILYVVFRHSSNPVGTGLKKKTISNVYRSLFFISDYYTYAEYTKRLSDKKIL